MPAELTELKVGGVTVKLRRAGNGPKVLFLHGAGGVPQWLPFFELLAERYELLVPEHPGFGGSDDPPWISSISDLAMFYLDLVEEAGLDRIHLFGNSLGGWLAAEILIRDRSRFQSLIQLAPAGIRIWGDDDKIMPPANAALWRERLPDARLVMVEGCGHLPHVEQAPLVARHVFKFLEGAV
jgi:pimeloyl-ACP methyl ester carboxylesterase